MTLDTKIETADMTCAAEYPIGSHVAKPYIVDMMEQLMLLAQEANLTHIASGLNTLLEPYRE